MATLVRIQFPPPPNVCVRLPSKSLGAGLLTCPRGAGVAHLFGKEEVTGPNPVVGSRWFCRGASCDVRQSHYFGRAGVPSSGRLADDYLVQEKWLRKSRSRSPEGRRKRWFCATLYVPPPAVGLTNFFGLRWATLFMRMGSKFLNLDTFNM